MKKFLYITPIFLLFLAVFFISGSRYFLPGILSAIFSKQLKAEVRISQAAFSFKDGVTAKGISVRNKKGLGCNIESATIGTAPLSTALITGKGTLPLIFTLKNIELSYPDSAIISSMARALSINQPGLLKFDTASGKLYYRAGELILKAWSASGEHLRLFVDGTVTDGSRINASFRILLSASLTASIPEATRKLFFKQDGSWSKVELYLSGDIRHPSINFSTDLFKLIVN